ncbi:Uncharacterised protein [Chlamydia trachomatis]|nr:Uncharacterised protein [Chlamydia trachomatis]
MLKDVPIPFNLLSEEDKKFFKSIFKDMKEKEKKYITKKMNSGVLQENIKFPEEYKKIINNIVNPKSWTKKINLNCFLWNDTYTS